MTRGFRRYALVLVLTVALIMTSLSLVACNGSNNSTASLRKATDVYALAGVSTGAILSSMSNNGTVALAGEETALDEEIVRELDEYMALVDSLVAGAPKSNEAKASDRPEYKTMQVMSVPGLDGKYTEYKLYYNEDNANAVAMDDDEEDEAEEEESEEDEYESHITGIMVIEGKEFPIKGDIEREADEQEIEFIAYLNEDKTDYIEFSQEAEANESEFEYSIYKNGQFVSSFELEMETENYKDEFELELEEADGSKTEFEIKKDNESGKIKVEYLKNGVKGTFDVEATTDADGKPVYKYILKDKEIETDRD